jgi:hypothetical protein
VADADPYWGGAAAINASVLLANDKDYAGMLALLNRYGYLYDERNRSSDDLAVAYNNRCYAYMKLGQPERALQDCDTSLQFGSLPETFSKQKDLMRELDSRAPLGDDGQD